MRTAIKFAARAVLAFHAVGEVILSPPWARVGGRCDGDDTEECESEPHDKSVEIVYGVVV